MPDDALNHVPSPEGNSVAMLARHVSGNLVSRFTNFLVEDGEKPDRDREAEFVERPYTRAEVNEMLRRGFDAVDTSAGVAHRRRRRAHGDDPRPGDDSARRAHPLARAHRESHGPDHPHREDHRRRPVAIAEHPARAVAVVQREHGRRQAEQPRRRTGQAGLFGRIAVASRRRGRYCRARRRDGFGGSWCSRRDGLLRHDHSTNCFKGRRRDRCAALRVLRGPRR